MLLSGPPSVLIVIQPAVEVKTIIGAAASEPDRRNAQFGKKREPDAQVRGGLHAREAADRGQRKLLFACLLGSPGTFAVGVFSVGSRMFHRSWLHETIGCVSSADGLPCCFSVAAGRTRYRPM